jgi:hypothetical protein
MNKRFAASRDASLPAWARSQLRDRAQVYMRSNLERFKHPDAAIRPIRIASDNRYGRDITIDRSKQPWFVIANDAVGLS